MTERYESASARHYAAYRPPLHSLALERVIGRHESFRVGLDVGCGTGYSAVALAKYCDRVHGLDPSRCMLDVAQPHPKITYLQGTADDLSRVPEPAFDVVTFAGSLVYAKTDGLRRELRRACPPGSSIVAYDFEVLLPEVMAALDMDRPAVATEYDHRLNLSDWDELRAERVGTERLRLPVTATEMAHVLLADSHRHAAFQGRFASEDPFPSVIGILGSGRVPMHLDADIYFARYRVR